jgi:hypothetical protein
VQSVFVAETAVFIELDPVGIVLLVFLGIVVALFALTASQCDLNSH